MEESAKKFIAEQVTGFDPSDIVGSSKRLRDALTRWRKMDETVRHTMTGLLSIVTECCEHSRATTGSNERDGSWMNPCPDCGHSY